MYYTYYKQIGNKILVRYKESPTVSNTVSKIFSDYKPTLFTSTTESESEFKSIFGYPLKPIKFDSMKAAKEFANQYKSVDQFVLEGNSNYGNQFIIELFDGKQPEYVAQNIKRNLVDIEVDAPVFPDPDKAEWPVTAITCYNNVEDVFYVAALRNDSVDSDWEWDQSKSPEYLQGLTVKFRAFNTEQELLQWFLDHSEQQQYDIISGWNSEGFDIPYLINRCTKVFNSRYVKSKLSPFGQIDEFTKTNSYGNEFTKFEIIGLSHLDYLELYKKFTFAPRESFKLDYIAQEELGTHKLSYEESGTLENLYRDDLQKYVDYNIQDVNLMKQLDEKLALFDIVFALTYYGMSNYEDTLGTVKYWEQLIAKYLYSQNIVPLFNRKSGGTRDFEGAYVREPVKGFHDWVFSIDLNSLYPHCIQQLNLGPETLIEPDQLPDEINELKDKVTFEQILSKTADLSVLQEYDISMSPSYAYYSKDKMSFLSALMRELYAQRKVFKKEMLAAEQKKVDSSSPEEKRKWEARESAMNNMQLAMKICLNSLYGALGQKSFLYYKVDNAEAITKFGQLINRWTCSRLETFFQQLFDTPDQTYWVYSDTDSGYFSIDSLVKSLPQTYETKQIVDSVDDFVESIVQPKIDQICHELCDYLNNYEQRMFWGREVIADKAAWVGKKKYVLHILNNEGVNFIGKNKYKIMGMESVKSSTPAWARAKLTELYKNALQHDESMIHGFIESTRTHYDQLPVSDIAIPRGTNDIEKYIDEHGMPGKGCPKHVRAAIVHNLFLDTYGLTRVPKIKSGDKIKFVELKLPNPFQSPVIGYVDYPPKEMELDKYVDRDLIFEAAFEKPAKIFLDAIQWNLEETNTLF